MTEKPQKETQTLTKPQRHRALCASRWTFNGQVIGFPCDCANPSPIVTVPIEEDQ